MSRKLIADMALAAGLALEVACSPVATPTLSTGLAQLTATLAAGAPPPPPTPPGTPGLNPLSATLEPTPTPPPTPTFYPTATFDDPDWRDLTVGVERREIVVTEPRTKKLVRLHMVRLDPAVIDFKVHYAPGHANTVSGWQAETGALVVVNGGFFDGELRARGVTFVDGEEFVGSPEEREDRIGLAGIFAVKDGQVSIVPLDSEAVLPGAFDFDQATEAYPMLLMPGGVPAYGEETGHAAQRTVVAVDEAGRVVFIVIRTGLFTLFGLSHTLAELDELRLDVALNLDGGKSSGMEVRAGPEHTHWNSESVLPIVIAAYPKEGVPVAPTSPYGPVYK